MASFRIRGGRPLEGRVAVQGSKNSALAILTAAALAVDGETTLENVPQYTDVLDLCQILRDLGAEVVWRAPGTLTVRGEGVSKSEAPYDLAKKLRGSTYIVGLLLARLGEARVAVPGGCNIGTRPIDFHLKGFRTLGAEVEVEHGQILARAQRLRGQKFFVDRSSVGTTINMMITASLAEGTTVLENAALEPEIVDLANFLGKLGVKVRGAGTPNIRIEGARRLAGQRHEIIPDRVVAGTYLMAGAITGGRVEVQQVIPEHLRTVGLKLSEAGAEIVEKEDSMGICSPRRLRGVDVQTGPHPGFATDLQQPFLTLMTLAEGVSVIQETVHDNRFGFVNELQRMGTNIRVDRDTAIVRGVEALTGAPVEAAELRGGVSLVLAGLAARGTTLVQGTHFIDRGYSNLEQTLQELGADIQRVE